jgi:ABC-type multidrug transport system permease subunit
VLSGFGMVYTAQLAIGSARFLAYSVGSGLAYLLTQVAAVGFIVLGTAWFLQFGSMLINALSAHPNLTTSEAV